jgi:hypothetical protein
MKNKKQRLTSLLDIRLKIKNRDAFLGLIY